MRHDGLDKATREDDGPRVPAGARRMLLGFAMTLAAILYIHRVCIAQSQHLISGELGLTRQQMGWAFTVFGIAYGLFEIPGGWLADRFGPRRTLTGGVGWWSFFTVATGWARGLTSLVGFRFLFGLGQAFCFPNLTRAFSNWFRGADRTRAQSLMWLAARWGGAFTPLLVVFTLEFVTWRQSFYLFGSIGFVWALFFWRWFRDHPAERDQRDGGEPQPIGTPSTSESVYENPVQRGMGFQPMNHRQDADATSPTGRMPVPLFVHVLSPLQ
jgi:MFS transporter, ACS family, glucarate transporter